MQKVKFHFFTDCIFFPVNLCVRSFASQGFFAFFVEIGSGYDRIEKTFYEHEKCALREIAYFNYFKNPWYAIKKRSSLKEMLKVK